MQIRTISSAPARMAIVIALTLALNLSISPLVAESPLPPGAAAAGDSVTSFNQAISARDGDLALAQPAEGGAQFTLRALHDGIESKQLQAEITQHWKTIAPVLFASTSEYSRETEILDERTEGDIATVWTRTKTRSLRRNSSEPSLNVFTEVYLLVRKPDGWKIAAIADNRQATSLAQ